MTKMINPNPHKGAEYFAQEVHFQDLDQTVQQVNGDHTDENANGCRAF
jgi:hypothetical protein